MSNRERIEDIEFETNGTDESIDGIIKDTVVPQLKECMDRAGMEVRPVHYLPPEGPVRRAIITGTKMTTEGGDPKVVTLRVKNRKILGQHRVIANAEYEDDAQSVYSDFLEQVHEYFRV